MSQADWARATARQRRQAQAYAAIIDSIPGVRRSARRPAHVATPYLDRLAAASSPPPWRQAAAEVFGVALQMAGPTYAAVVADELVRLAPEVRTGRRSPLDARNIAFAHAKQVARDEQATDLLEYADSQALELHRPVVAPSPLLAPELIETVTSYAATVYGRPLTDGMRHAIEAGLPVVVELVETYADDARRPGAVLVSMQARQSGRPGRCLAARCRKLGMADRAALALGRLLAGRGCDAQTSLLWHALRGTRPRALPVDVVRWARRDLADLDPAQFADDLHRARFRHRLSVQATREWQRRDLAPDEGMAVGQ